MAKGIRSKCRRASRTEFRNTIGEDWAQKQMNIVQAKLQECVQNGSMNSFEKLGNVLNGSNRAEEDDDDNMSQSNEQSSENLDDNGIDQPGYVVDNPFPSSYKRNNTIVSSTKPIDKIPVKSAANSNKAKTKRRQWIPNPVDQTGAKLMTQKIAKMKRRGQWKNGQKVHKGNGKHKARKPRRSFI